MAMAPRTLFLCFIEPSSSSSSVLKHKSHLHPNDWFHISRIRDFHAWWPELFFSAVVAAERINEEESVDPQNDDVYGEEEQNKKLGRPCQVYVCNLPRSCDAAHLLDMFKPHGTILSVRFTGMLILVKVGGVVMSQWHL